MARQKNVNIDWVIVEKQLSQGITQVAIAKNLGMSVQNLNMRLKKHRELKELSPISYDQKAVDKFKENRADIFADIQRMTVSTFTEADLKKASARDRAIILGTLYDKERLERGQTTDNVGLIQRIIGDTSSSNIPTVEACKTG